MLFVVSYRTFDILTSKFSSCLLNHILTEHAEQERTGWIEVICGCMFSGKTEELIRRLNRAINCKTKVEIFKPVRG